MLEWLSGFPWCLKEMEEVILLTVMVFYLQLSFLLTVCLQGAYYQNIVLG